MLASKLYRPYNLSTRATRRTQFVHYFMQPGTPLGRDVAEFVNSPGQAPNS